MRTSDYEVALVHGKDKRPTLEAACKHANPKSKAIQYVEKRARAHTCTYTQTHRHTDTQTQRHTDRQTDKQTDGQTDRRTDRQTHARTHKEPPNENPKVTLACTCVVLASRVCCSTAAHSKSKRDCKPSAQRHRGYGEKPSGGVQPGEPRRAQPVRGEPSQARRRKLPIAYSQASNVEPNHYALVKLHFSVLAHAPQPYCRRKDMQTEGKLGILGVERPRKVQDWSRQ